MTDRISSAIATCQAAQTMESSARAYEALLSAVGNSHAGTYNSSALNLVKALGPLLASTGPWSQRAILEALIDLYGSFEPEPDSQVHLGSPLAALLRQRIAALEPSVLAVAESASVPSASAEELLELLHEPAA